MKTVLIRYLDTLDRVNKSDKRKLYAFNIEDSEIIEEGVIYGLNKKLYSNYILVVKVLDESFKYYNSSTGDLLNNYSNTGLKDIKLLKLVEESSDDTVEIIKL